MTAGAVPGFNPEDLFGLRRALNGLPEELRDVLLARLVELGERTDCDVEAIRSGAREAAREYALVEGADRLCVAWCSVVSAIGSYLEWRAACSRTAALS